MLFGVELKPGLEFAHTFVQDTKLTAATLAVKKASAAPKDTVYLKVQVEDGWLPVAALRYGSEENVPLRLYFEEGEVAAFRLEGEGKNFSVGLSGFVVPEQEGDEEDEDEMMMRMMGGEEDDDESDESGEEDISQYSKKDMAALMRKIAGDRMEDDSEDDEDDSEDDEDDSSFESVPSDQDEELDSDELCPDVPSGVQIEEVDEEEEEEEEKKKPAKKEAKKESKQEKTKKQKEKEEWDRKIAEKKAAKAEAAAKGQKRGQDAEEEEKKPAKKAKKEVKAEPKPEPKRQVQGGVTIEDLNVPRPGKQAKKGSHVKIKYTGRLTNGKVFDSNVRSGKPLAFRVASGDVIPGFDIGVTGMVVGGKRRVSIPPRLGYGSQRIPGIPPNSTLVFDIELVNLR